jgi:hypothetical protein
MQTFEWFKDEDVGPVYEKGKSDIVKRMLDKDVWRFLLDHLSIGIDVEITALGGAVNDIAWNETAFPHRGDSKLVIQWGTAWQRPDQAGRQLREINELYAKMRPYMSSAALLNYVDRDIAEPARAYWAKNLERLIKVKRKYDPNNLFRHPLSVPMRLGRSDWPPKAGDVCLRAS